MKYLFTLLTLLCAASITVYAQPGTLDKTFGDGGIVIGKTYNGGCNDLLIQQDGKIIGVGTGAYGTPDGSFLLVRYNTDGTLDLSFGDSGRVTTNVSSRSNYGSYGALQEDGKIIVAGYVAQQGDGNNLTVLRYNADGAIDSSFGTNGVVIEAIGKQFEFPTGIVVQSDGKIVVGGYTADFSEGSNYSTIYLVRYNKDGSHDLSFGIGGIYQEAIAAVFKTGGLALQPDGKLLVGGYNNFAGNPFFVRRYTKDGALDREFGNNGEARYYFSQEAYNGSSLHSLALQPDGKIIAAGSAYKAGVPSATLVRFNTDGSTDNTFGQKGSVISDIGKYNSDVFDLTLQPDGKIVAAVNSVDINELGSIAFAVARYLKDGTLDSSFGVNGSQTTVIDEQSTSVAVALQQDGKIVLGGYSATLNPYTYHVTLARYNGDNSKQPLTIRIKRWLQHHGISWQKLSGNNVRYYTVQRSNDGITYKEAARVNGSINNYEDAAGTGNYYRLVAVVKDGSHTYSNTILIDEAQQARIFPNPVRDNLQLQGLPPSGNTNVSVLDLYGNLRSTATATGSNYSVNTANLSSGSYLLKIQHNGTTTTQPFVKE